MEGIEHNPVVAGEWDKCDHPSIWGPRLFIIALPEVC
jgi:hypothetical protein